MSLPAHSEDPSQLSDDQVRLLAVTAFWDNVNNGDNHANDEVAESTLAEWRRRDKQNKPPA
jgi:hypothetical protein